MLGACRKTLSGFFEACRQKTDKVYCSCKETSVTRKTAIAGITYVVAVIVLFLIGAENIFLGALVPVIGFLLSTQSLPFLKQWWLSFRK